MVVLLGAQRFQREMLMIENQDPDDFLLSPKFFEGKNSQLLLSGKWNRWKVFKEVTNDGRKVARRMRHRGGHASHGDPIPGARIIQWPPPSGRIAKGDGTCQVSVQACIDIALHVSVSHPTPTLCRVVQACHAVWVAGKATHAATRLRARKWFCIPCDRI
jgi:hypothetical protein